MQWVSGHSYNVCCYANRCSLIVKQCFCWFVIRYGGGVQWICRHAVYIKPGGCLPVCQSNPDRQVVAKRLCAGSRAVYIYIVVVTHQWCCRRGHINAIFCTSP